MHKIEVNGVEIGGVKEIPYKDGTKFVGYTIKYNLAEIYCTEEEAKEAVITESKAEWARLDKAFKEAVLLVDGGE